MSLESIDQAAAAVAVAPRVTADDIKALLEKSTATTIVHKTLTIVVIELPNGFMVTGESAAASPENFNVELGQKIARDRAVEKIWPLLGYALRERLAAEAPA